MSPFLIQVVSVTDETVDYEEISGQKSDSLYFDSDKPHGPKKIISDECQFLTIICTNNSD